MYKIACANRLTLGFVRIAIKIVEIADYNGQTVGLHTVVPANTTAMSPANQLYIVKLGDKTHKVIY
jgi:hypothetical protein